VPTAVPSPRSGCSAASPTPAATIRADLADVGVPGVRSQAQLARAGRLPGWLGDPAFHRSHQSALVRKDPDWYRPHFPDVPDDLPYVWPASDLAHGA
jgi:hypothetical protein